jgi:hypothetical protein
MEVVNEIGQNSSLLVDNNGSLKVSSSTTNTQFRKNIKVTEEFSIPPIVGGNENTGGITVSGNGTATPIPIASGQILVFPQIEMNNASADARVPVGGTIPRIASDYAGKGLGYIKIKDFDPNSYATKGRFNVCIKPIANTGQGAGAGGGVGSESGGDNPSVFTNYSYHIVGFNDGSNELTTAHYSNGAPVNPFTTLMPFNLKKTGTPYSAVIGEGNQIVPIALNHRLASQKTSETQYSNISNSFPLSNDNYFIIFNNNFNAPANQASTQRQPDLKVWISLDIYN